LIGTVPIAMRDQPGERWPLIVAASALPLTAPLEQQIR